MDNFFDPSSTYGNFSYRLLFEAGDKKPRSVRLPAPFLFKVSRNGWSFSEDVLDEYLASDMPGHPNFQQESDEEEDETLPSFAHEGEPSSYYHGEGSSSQLPSMDGLSLQQTTWDMHLTPQQQYEYMQQQPPSGWNSWDQHYQ